jgi:hypothetical protein
MYNVQFEKHLKIEGKISEDILKECSSLGKTILRGFFVSYFFEKSFPTEQTLQSKQNLEPRTKT